MYALVASVMLAAQSSPEWRVLLDQAMSDAELASAVKESTARPVACVADALEKVPPAIKPRTLDQELPVASERCGFDAAVRNAASRIKARFTDVSNELAGRTADMWLTDLVLSEGTATAE